MGEVEDVVVGEGLCTLLFLLFCTRIGFVQSASYFGTGYLINLHCAIVDGFKSLFKVREKRGSPPFVRTMLAQVSDRMDCENNDAQKEM